MIDHEKILSKIDQINQYLEEIGEIKPLDFEEYKLSLEKRRSCERLFQITIENVMDVYNILVSNLKLGIPEDEDAVFEKLNKKKIISNKMIDLLKNMKGFRNILVHKYGEVDDELVFENFDKLQDFELFKTEILEFLKKQKK